MFGHKLAPQAPAPVEPELLRQFEPFSHLSENELVLVATKASLHPFSFYLLEGTVELEAHDGKKKVIQAGTEQAKQPVAQLKPRQFSARSLSPIKYLQVDTGGFGDFAEGIRQDIYKVEEMDVVEQYSDGSLVLPQQQELQENRLTLPSLPAVAMKVRQLIDQDDASTTSIARLVNTDPAIAAKLIKAANSPLYHGFTGVDTSDKAITRLGTKTTRQLVVTFAMHELFRSGVPALRERMEQLWDHSTEVSAVAFVLARLTGQFDPDQALLAGLLHDIGALPYLSHAESHPEILDNPVEFEASIKANRSRFGAMILEKWNFPEPFVLAATYAEDWLRDSRDGPDMGDLIIVAQIHSFMGKTDVKPKLPPLPKLPAFQKIAGGTMDADLSIEVLQQSRDQIREARSFLTGS
jgi:HD-like signal output (HDOD) protein